MLRSRQLSLALLLSTLLLTLRLSLAAELDYHPNSIAKSLKR